MSHLKNLVAAVSLVTLSLGASAALAQSTAPAQPTTTAAQQQDQAMVSDAELRQFVNASIEISRIREDYTERLNNAKDQPIAQQLQQEAQDKMISAVETAGLDADSYNQLSERIQSSPELQERLQTLQ